MLLSSLLIPFAACCAVIALGALVLWISGRAADGHPHCRRCRFDLIGTPQAHTCPECGADLNRKRAVLINTRHRARSLLVTAVVSFVGAGALTTPSVRAYAASVDWMRHKPTWLLVHETRNTDPARVGPVLRELLKRYEAGEMPDATVLKLAEQGYEYLNTGSPCGMWNSEYGNFIDIAIARGLLAGERKRQYKHNAVGLAWIGPSYRSYPEAPPNPYFGVYPMVYVGKRSRSAAAEPPVDFTLLELTASVDGEQAEVNLSFREGGPVRGDTSLGSAIIELPEVWQGRTLKISWKIQIVEFRSREAMGEPWVGARTIKLDAEVRGGARRQDDKVPPKISRY